MEHYDPARRQYAPTSYPTQQPQQGAAPSTGPYGTPGSVERFRQSGYMQQSPTSAPGHARGSSDAQQLYNFSQGVQYATGTSMPAHPMQYGQEYQPQEPRQQTQQYPQYGTNVMYSMQQAQAAQAHAQAQAQSQVQQPQQSPYGPVPTFRQERSTAAAETLASQFGEPQTAQYYLAGQGVPTSAPSSDLAGQQQMHPQYQQTAYPQPAPVASQAYPGAMLDPTQSAAAYQQAYGQSAHYGPQHHQPQQQQTESIDQAFTRYQNQVRAVFTRAREGNLRDTPDQLIQISNYLLGSAEALGMVLE